MYRLLHLAAKHGDTYVLARDKEEELRAYMYLFTCMDDAGYYRNLKGDQGYWYADARGGDRRAARALLCYRSVNGYEYETIDAVEAVIP